MPQSMFIASKSYDLHRKIINVLLLSFAYVTCSEVRPEIYLVLRLKFWPAMTNTDIWLKSNENAD